MVGTHISIQLQAQKLIQMINININIQLQTYAWPVGPAFNEGIQFNRSRN